VSGYVKADGTSAVPDGVVDLAAAGQDLVLDAAVAEKLETVWKDVERSELKARYKLEVAFTEDRSVHRPFSGFVVALTNGGFAHGGGDEAVYFCIGDVERDGVPRKCHAPLDLKWVGRDAAVCPVCRSVVRPADLAGQIYAKLPMQHWASLITRIFYKLGCDADLRIGTMRGDLRRATELEQVRERRGEHLNGVRLQRQWVIYPLANILKDTASGASLSSRVRAFLHA
jgi:hypothetical protein